MAAEQKVVELVIDASGVERGVQRAEAAYEHLGARGDAAAVRVQAAFDKQFQSFSARLPKSIDQVSNAYDNLQAKLDPLFSAQLRAEREMTQSMAVINRAVMLGVTTEEQATRDILRLKQQQVDAINRTRDAQLQANAVSSAIPNAANDNTARYRRQQATYQYFDIGTTLSGGMNPAVVAMQQGPQLLQIYAGNGGVNAALGDAATLAGTLAKRLAPVAIAAAAAGLAFQAMQKDIEAATGKSVAFSDVATGALKIIGNDIYSLVAPGFDFMGEKFDFAMKKIGPAAVDVAELVINSFRAAYADIEFLWNQFPNMIGATVIGAANNVIETMANMVQTAVNVLDTFHGKLNEYLPERLQIPTMGDLGLKDLLLQNDYLDNLKKGVDDRNKKIDEIMSSTPLRDYAKSVTDRLADQLQFEQLPETGPVPGKNPRRSLDADPALESATKADNRLRQLRQEIEAFGLTAGAAAKLRYEQEQLNNAIDKHIELSPQQRSQITKDAAAIGAMTDQLARMRLQQDAQFELDQLFRSDREGRIASQLRSSGLEVDLGGQNAAMLRTIDLLKEQKKAWEDIRDVGKDAVDQIVDSATGGFENIGEVFDVIAKDVLKQFTTLGVANPLKNAIFGGELPTMDTVGGVGGIFRALTGGSNPALDAAGKSVGAMTVTAATVVVNGGVGGGIPGLSNLKSSAANQNDPFAAVMKSGGGSPLSFVGNYKSGVDSRLTDILNEAALRTPGLKVDAMSGFRAGDPRFHGKGLATDVQLTDLVSRRKLGNYQDASSFRQYEQFAQTAREVQMEKFPELADKFRWGGYFGGGKGKYGAVDSMHFDLAGAGMAGGSWQNGMTSAQQNLWPGIESKGMAAVKSLGNLATTTDATTQGLGTFGTGLGQIGNALSQSGPSGAGGGGGGLFGWLGSLFGGGGGSADPWAGMRGVPAHADGTDFAPGGLSWIGERGKELMRVPRGAEIIPAHRTSVALAPSPASVSFKSTVINNSSSQVEERETTDENGGRGVEYVISDRVASAMGKRGGAADRMLKARGATVPRTRR